ncbi:acyl-CoA thioesterase [Alkalicella caledoniensis]|uniref:Acyl-CoA thioesterase n=1 Tax=Alkalicella caledoniensis TaxID=2731377 RepID=A0A7G9W4Y2_ALKCA|nr:thioesterase family protein [Alkalicella caledoniensis]QNO13744.1 acyl-CoA thioesterase [Alkalicella caledoniensis]
MHTTIKVRYAETDQMGVVYHSNYLIWFEVARTEFMESKGVNYKELEENGLFLPVVEANCRYKRSAKYNDILTIKTTVELQGRKIIFRYKIYKEDQLLSEGYTIHVFINKEGYVITLEKAEPNIYQKLKTIAN